MQNDLEEGVSAIGMAEIYEMLQHEPAKQGIPKAVLMRINPPPLPAWSTYTVGAQATDASRNAGQNFSNTDTMAKSAIVMSLFTDSEGHGLGEDDED